MKILIVAAFVALACADEEGEQKKRGAGKTTLNAIPSGGGKTDYTYSIYNQNPASNSVSPSYQTQVPNSFYPTQSGGSQYYQPGEQAGYPPQPAPYSPPAGYPQPQLNLLPPPSSSQFLPINFVPNSGYQAKYQIIPSKGPNGNIQLAILQPQSSLQSPQIQYPQSIFQSNSPYQINAPHSFLSGGQGGFPNYQQYLGQPSMLLLQPNPSLYSNLLYPGAGPSPSLYNYNYQGSPQAKYNVYYGGSPPASQPPAPSDYDKLQAGSQHAAAKEDNEINIQTSDYITPESSNYKNSYVTSRTSYKN
ncbi:calcium-binding protein P [Plutella xylostella]|uniref:calcium-binding protein P n=1 Tax=Plutella xylostella TaxID=51655 RepID=UPI002033107A|nr:calcium-binding protein P [Plutella xylostella]